jgi:hypothetical protein
LLTQYSGYLLADKQYEKVLEVLTSDLALRKPLTPGQLLVRGRALIHLRQPQYALNDVQEAYARREEPTLFPSAIDPKGQEMECLLAEVYFINKKYENALALFEIIFAKYRPEPRTVLAYAECLSLLGGDEVFNFLRQQAQHRDDMHIIINSFKSIVSDNKQLGANGSTLLKMQQHLRI